MLKMMCFFKKDEIKKYEIIHGIFLIKIITKLSVLHKYNNIFNVMTLADEDFLFRLYFQSLTNNKQSLFNVKSLGYYSENTQLSDFIS